MQTIKVAGNARPAVGKKATKAIRKEKKKGKKQRQNQSQNASAYATDYSNIYVLCERKWREKRAFLLIRFLVIKRWKKWLLCVRQKTTKC